MTVVGGQPATFFARTLAAALLAAALATGPAEARRGEPCAKPGPEMVEAIGPAVVSVTAVLVDPFATHERVTFGHGSGVVLDPGGEVLTNAHLVAEAELVIVTLEAERTLPAERVALDPVFDLALLRLADPLPGLVAAPLGSSAAAEVGDEVLALGNPFGLGRTASRGIVSALERIVPITTTSWLSPFLQTDAAVDPGSSGGPSSTSAGRSSASRPASRSAARSASASGRRGRSARPRSCCRNGRSCRRTWLGCATPTAVEELPRASPASERPAGRLESAAAGRGRDDRAVPREKRYGRGALRNPLRGLRRP